MLNTIRSLYQQLTSKDTWKRAKYLSRGRDPEEVSQEIKKEDYVPVAIGVVFSVLAAVALGILIWLIVALLK